MTVKLELTSKLNYEAQAVDILRDKMNVYRERSDIVPHKHSRSTLSFLARFSGVWK